MHANASSNNSGFLAGSFGVAAGAGALFFLGEIPRVRKDILMKVPFLDRYFDRTTDPEDNVSLCNQLISEGEILTRSSPSKLLHWGMYGVPAFLFSEQDITVPRLRRGL